MRILYFFLVFLLSSPLTLFAAEAEPSNGIIAQVGEVPITIYELQRQINRVLPLRVSFHGGVSAEKKAEVRQEAIDDLIERALKVQYAIDNEIPVPKKKIDAKMKEVRERFKSKKEFKDAVGAETIDGLRSSVYRQFLADQAEEVAVNATTEAQEEELKSYYEANKQTFFLPKQFRASHILIKVDPSSNQQERDALKEKAEGILERAQKGEDFFDLAYYNSDDRTKFVGGDLGMFHEGQTEKPFEDALKLLKIGEISDVVETRFGYHIIKLTQVNEPRQMSYEEMRTKIKERLEKERRDSLYKSWISELKEKYEVKRFVE